MAEPTAGLPWVRFWDLASTKPQNGNDPDYTVGILLGMSDGVWFVRDIKRTRTTPGGVEKLVRQTAELDGDQVKVRMEQEPGSSGKNTIDNYRRSVLVGFDFRGIPSTGSKILRAGPVSSASEAGNVKLVMGP